MSENKFFFRFFWIKEIWLIPWFITHESIPKSWKNECDLGVNLEKAVKRHFLKAVVTNGWTIPVLLHELYEEFAAARLLGQVRKLMSATWGELVGCCRNCCVLLFKLGCQFKDHIKFVILLLMAVTLPLITC